MWGVTTAAASRGGDVVHSSQCVGADIGQEWPAGTYAPISDLGLGTPSLPVQCCVEVTDLLHTPSSLKNSSSAISNEARE
jgi:hypothetical protein